LTWALQESYVDSVERLYLAALELRSVGDPTTAGHLFGVSAECALKATLERANIVIDKKSPYRCHIPALLQQILTKGQGRQMTGIVQAIAALKTLSAEYTVDTRYAADGNIDAARCTLWQAETETILISCGFVV
jgi:hypothetical protein